MMEDTEKDLPVPRFMLITLESLRAFMQDRFAELLAEGFTVCRSNGVPPLVTVDVGTIRWLGLAHITHDGPYSDSARAKSLDAFCARHQVRWGLPLVSGEGLRFTPAHQGAAPLPTQGVAAAMATTCGTCSNFGEKNGRPYCTARFFIVAEADAGCDIWEKRS